MFFTKEAIPMVSEYMKKSSVPLFIRWRQIQTMMRHHYAPSRVVNMKEKTKTKSCRGVAQSEFLDISDGSMNLSSRFGKLFGSVYLKPKHRPALGPNNYSIKYLSESSEIPVHRKASQECSQ